MARNSNSKSRPKLAKARGLTFQDLLLKLEHYWTTRDCILQQPYDIEVGAGTMHPETFLRVLGPDPYRVVYAQPSRRPADGRYGENPNRLYKHTQLQVILKPSPADIQDLYLASLAAVGINLKEHDIRFEEDNWESPTLGAWGIGWQVLLDGLEITQFTYFQQCGGVDLDPISVELTYGLDRIAAYLQGVDNVFDVRWSNSMTYRQVRLAEEQQFSAYSFDYADTASTRKQFDLNETEASRLLATYDALKGAGKERFPVLQAYDFCLKCSHLFNVLDARGAISVTERAGMIARVRKLATQVARAWLDQRAAIRIPAGASA
ncbi:MAG TPA: glycine--tRNA ligase subunit alpha [Candidatus Acidoferrales bacterium]